MVKYLPSFAIATQSWNLINEQMRHGGRSELRQLNRNDSVLSTIEAVISQAA
jgi:hypothetical protein